MGEQFDWILYFAYFWELHVKSAGGEENITAALLND
jgi:hypothetical protein